MTITKKELLSEQALRNAMLPENRKKFDSREVRLSGIGLCERKQVLGALEGMDPIAWEYDQGGHILQKALADILREDGYQLDEEVEVKHPFGTAHIDIITYGFPDRHIIECKTIKCSGLQYDLPKENNILQVKGQMMFREEEHELQPTAEIVYMCRDHFGEHFKAFEVQFPSMEERLQIRQMLQRVHEAVAAERPPEKPFEEPIWQCAYKTREGGELKEIRCPFYGRCWEEGAKTETIPVPVQQISESDEVGKQLLQEYKFIVADWSSLKQSAEVREARKKNLEEILVAHFGDFQALSFNGTTVKRTQVNRDVVDWKGATKGLNLDLTPFTKTTSYSKYTLQIKGGE